LALAAILIPSTILVPVAVAISIVIPTLIHGDVVLCIPRQGVGRHLDGDSGLIAAHIGIGGYGAQPQQKDHRTYYVKSAQDGCFCTGFHCLCLPCLYCALALGEPDGISALLLSAWF
jgi:hypothetical protein